MPEAWRTMVPLTVYALRLQYPTGRVTAGSELALIPFSFTYIPRRRLTLLLPVEKGCDNGFKISSDLNHTKPPKFCDLKKIALHIHSLDSIPECGIDQEASTFISL